MNKVIRLDKLVKALKVARNRLSKHVEEEKHKQDRENWIDVKALDKADSMLTNSYHPIVGNRILLTMTTIEELQKVLREVTERLKIHNEKHLYEDNIENLDDENAIKTAIEALEVQEL